MKIHRILIALLTILVIFIGYQYMEVLMKKDKKEEIAISPVIFSLEDNIDRNDFWCGSFNVLWESLTKDADIKGINDNNKVLIDNLNKKTFTKDSMGSSYYNIYGVADKDLKKRMTKELNKKMKSKGNVVDNISWKGEYLIYSMLNKNIKFKKNFDVYDKEKFKTSENVSYYGIKMSSSDDLRNEVTVLYYQDINNFAIKLNTTSDDEVILARGIKGNNFKELYDMVRDWEKKYDGDKEFTKYDLMKIPSIDFSRYEKIDELKNIEVKDKKIESIIRDITFKMNNDKAEKKTAEENGKTIDKKSRLFYLTSDFNVFIKEKNKELPYFAMSISDITMVQKL